METDAQPMAMPASELSMELDGLEDSMRSIDLGSSEVQAAAELVVSGEAVSPNRMKELERMFPPESGGAMKTAIASSPPPPSSSSSPPSSSPPPPPATLAVAHPTGSESRSLLAPGARLPDDCLLQIFRWLRPWPDLAVASVVCRKFRRILTRGRSLWSNLVVAADDHLCGKPYAVVDGVLESLARRAGRALRQLTIRGCEQLTSAGLNAVVAQCGQHPSACLTTIELSDCTWVGMRDLLDVLTGCRGLLHLSATGCRGRGEPTAGGYQPSRLTHLKLDDARFTGAELLALLQRCPDLEHLQIFSVPRAAGRQLVQVVAAASPGNLHTLQLGDAISRVGHWTDSSSVMMESSLDTSIDPDNVPGEGVLDSALSTVNDTAVQALLEQCAPRSVSAQSPTSVLTVLEFSGFSGLHGSALAAIPTTVCQLSLRGCSSLGSLDLPLCSRLLALDLEECCALTDSALIHIGRQCPRLIELNVQGCEQLTDVAISASVEAGGFQNLQRLNTRGCPSITSTGLSSLAHAGLGQSATGIGYLTHLAVGYDSDSVHSLNLPPAAQPNPTLLEAHAPNSMDISSSNTEVTSPVEQDQSPTVADEAAAGVWRWLAPIDDQGLAALALISPLQVLDISGCRLTGAATTSLSTQSGTTAPVRQFLIDVLGGSGTSAASQCLQELRISSCPGFGRLQSLARTIPTLTSLTLSACQALGDDDLGTLIDGCPALRYLFLDDCHAITGRGVGIIGHRCRCLTTLCISQCNSIADDVTFTDTPPLQELSLFDCANITDISALTMIVACGSLWRSPGSIRIDRCSLLRSLKASLPRGLVASVLSFSGGESESNAGCGELVPLIVQAMARVAS